MPLKDMLGCVDPVTAGNDAPRPHSLQGDLGRRGARHGHPSGCTRSPHRAGHGPSACALCARCLLPVPVPSLNLCLLQDAPSRSSTALDPSGRFPASTLHGAQVAGSETMGARSAAASPPFGAPSPPHSRRIGCVAETVGVGCVDFEERSQLHEAACSPPPTLDEGRVA